MPETPSTPGPWGKISTIFPVPTWWSGTGGADWFCKQGFGSLVARYGQGIPVEFNNVTKLIRWGGKGVEIETNKGTIKAEAVVLTVATGVLADGDIRFDPALPAKKEESFHKISMGHYNHVAIQFSEDIFELGDDGIMAYQSDSDRSMGLLTNASGSNLSYAYVGGSLARELELAGKQAAIDFAVSELKKVYGSSVGSFLSAANYTKWGEDEWTRGAYASDESGYAHMRKVLRRPVGRRIYFAGKACHRTQWATCAGAYLSGVETAKIVAKKVR